MNTKADRVDQVAVNIVTALRLSGGMCLDLFGEFGGKN